MKIERDQVEVTGGVRHGRTLGGPIALQVTNRDYANWEERMNPWPVEAAVAEVHLPRPGHADLVGTQKYGLTDVRDILERASARETAARVAGGAVAKAFLGRARRPGLLARDPDHVRHRAATPTPRRRTTSRPSTSRPVRCLDPEASGDGRGDRPPAQGQRVAGRRLRGARVRPRPRPRLARLLGGAARRPSAQAVLSIQAIKAVSIGDGYRGRRPARLTGPRRDLLRRRAAASTARPTARAGSRAA